MRGRAIIIKGDDTKIYKEVIFVLRDDKPDLILADKIITKFKKINKLKNILECVFYFVLISCVIVIIIKIILI